MTGIASSIINGAVCFWIERTGENDWKGEIILGFSVK